jgi:leucyl aminopeptidase
MAELGMGALLAVAAGSDQPPKFIVMQYQGDPANESNNVALCGKGITFDSGGISIKPAEGMGAMKGDMAGGASVIGAMRAIAALKPKINVMALIPATENMSGGSATRPGDVVRGMTGKSIEIDNTDAEGRLVLADAIGYARQHGQRRIVDVATLTGAAVVALGNTAAAVMGNDQDLVDRVIKAGESAGEKFWQLPLFEEYREQINSDIADMKNTGGRPAGSITAGYFIQEFAGDVPWVHLDIAGMARTDRERGYIVKGHTGIPVRTLVNLVVDMAENA